MTTNPPVKRTKAQAEKEARAAANKVIKAHLGLPLIKINREIRKACPFGPNATAQEKEIWRKVCQEAEIELSKWPRPISALLIGLVLAALALPVQAQDAVAVAQPLAPVIDTTPAQPIKLIFDGENLLDEKGNTVGQLVPVKKSKVPFKEAHPKIHALVLKTSRTARILNPILEFAARCAQIAYPFL